MKIVIETIPHSKQRYETCGDYWFDGKVMHIRVSDTGDSRSMFAVAVHELIEYALCIHDGVREEDIAAFDMLHLESEDPGGLPEAPYHDQHTFAECLERLFVQRIGLGWAKHEALIDGLFN
jgi:hypothetical protein